MKPSIQSRYCSIKLSEPDRTISILGGIPGHGLPAVCVSWIHGFPELELERKVVSLPGKAKQADLSILTSCGRLHGAEFPGVGVDDALPLAKDISKVSHQRNCRFPILRQTMKWRQTAWCPPGKQCSPLMSVPALRTPTVHPLLSKSAPISRGGETGFARRLKVAPSWRGSSLRRKFIREVGLHCSACRTSLRQQRLLRNNTGKLSLGDRETERGHGELQKNQRKDRRSIQEGMWVNHVLRL